MRMGASKEMSEWQMIARALACTTRKWRAVSVSVGVGMGLCVGECTRAHASSGGMSCDVVHCSHTQTNMYPHTRTRTPAHTGESKASSAPTEEQHLGDPYDTADGRDDTHHAGQVHGALNGLLHFTRTNDAHFHTYISELSHTFILRV